MYGMDTEPAMEAVASDLTASQEGANGNEVVSDVAMETAVPSHEVAEKRPNEVDQAEDPPEKKVKMAEQDDQPMTEEVRKNIWTMSAYESFFFA